MNDVSPLDPANRPKARIIPRAEHSISRSAISPNALRVLYRLREAGYEAFLVGGCVRDLLIGITPKDFDIATSALPEEVKRTFRNCRLIGRRFRLAHVFFGREIIEVATFRAMSAPEVGEEIPEPAAADLDDDVDDELLEDDLDDEDEVDESLVLAEAGPHQTGFRRNSPSRERDRSRHAGAGDDEDEDRVTDEHGRILRDNAYGTIDDDVWRRDFTANALYYNIADFSIWDYAGGVEDIAARRLKLIGDPVTRYREDPVRMLRAARFQAKLGFSLDGETGTAIHNLRELLGSVPPARLFDETLKLFLTGHGARSLEVLQGHGLLAELLPTVASYLERHPDGAVSRLVRQGLANTDQRVAAGKPVTPTFLFALLLYGPFAEIIEKQPQEKWHDIGAIVDAVDRAARGAQGRISIPKRFSLGVREMFAAQPRLEQPARPSRLAHARAATLPCRLRSAAAARRHGPGVQRARGVVDEGPGSFADRPRPHGRRTGAAAAVHRWWRWWGVAPVDADPAGVAADEAAHPRLHDACALATGLRRGGQQPCRPANAGAARNAGTRSPAGQSSHRDLAAVSHDAVG